MADTFDPASILSTLQSRARAAAAGTDPIALQYGNGTNPLAKFLPKEPKPEALPQLDVGDLQRQIAALDRAQRSGAKEQKDAAGASLAGLADSLTGATGGAAPATPGKLEQLFTPDMQWGGVVSSPQWKELPFAEQSRQRKLWVDGQVNKVTAEAGLKPNDPRIADFRKRLETNTQIGEAPSFEWLNNDWLDAGIKSVKDMASGVKLALGGDTGEAIDARKAAAADFNANASAKTLDEQKVAALRQRIAERDAGPEGLTAGKEASLAVSNFTDAPFRNTVAQLPSTAGSLVGGAAGAAVGSLAGPGGTAAGFVAGSTATNAALTAGDVASGAAEAIDAMDEATLRKSDKFNALLQANNGDVGRAKKALTVAVAREAAVLGAAVGAGEGAIEGVLPGVGKAAKGALKAGAADAVAEVGAKGIVAQALSKFGLVDASKNGALKKFAERVGKPTGDGLARTVAGEAAQEFGAEYAGQVAQNLSVRDAGGMADQRLTEGAVGAGVTGALAGAGTGGGAKVIGYGAQKAGLGPRRDDNGDIYVTPVFAPDGNVTGVKRIGRKDAPGNVVVDEGTGLARLVDAAPVPAEGATPEDVARSQQQLAIDARTVASNNAAIFSRLGDAAGLTGGARDLFSAYATAFSLEQLNHPAGIALSDGSRADFTFGQNGEVNFVADENTAPEQRAEAERIEGTVNTALAALIDPLSQYFSRVQNRLAADVAPVAPEQKPGDANAAQEGQVKQGDQQQREGAGAGLPQNGEDRNLSPIVGEGGPETGGGNSPVEGGAQPQGQEVAPAPVAETPQPAPEPGMPESAGRWFSYGGIEGQLVRRQSGFYVVPANNPGEAVFVEGGESGQPPSALGLTPYTQQPNPAAVAAAARARQDPTQLPAVAGAVSAANAPTSLDDRFNAAIDGLLALLGEDATADILAALDVPGQNFETLTKKVEAAYYEQLDAATKPAGQATPIPTDGGAAPNVPGPAATSPGPSTAETTPAPLTEAEIDAAIEAENQGILEDFELVMGRPIPPFRSQKGMVKPTALTETQKAQLREGVSEALARGVPADLVMDVQRVGATRMKGLAFVVTEKSWFGLGSQWAEVPQPRRNRTVVHELGHIFDARQNDMSQTAAWDQAHAEMAAWAKAGQPDLAYPFADKSMPRDRKRYESYAQAFMLMFHDREGLRQNAPVTYRTVLAALTELQKENRDRIRNPGLRTVVGQAPAGVPSVQTRAPIQGGVGGDAGLNGNRDVLPRAEKAGQAGNARLTSDEAVDTRSADRFPLAANVVALLENNNLSAALEELGRTEAPAYAALAKRLAPLLAATRVSVVDNLVNANGESLYGDAASDGSDIRIDRAKGLTTETLLHEALHAATERTLQAGTFKRTLNENVGVRELNSLWASVKASGINMPGGSRDSLSEFVSEALTDAQFIAELDSYKWKASSFWENFKSALLRMLGFTPSTPYRAALMSADAIFRPTAGAPVQPPGGGGPRLNRVTPAELVAQSRARVKSPPASIARAVRQGLAPSIKQRSATAEVRQAGRTAAERINDAFADSLGPVARWIDRLPVARQVSESLKGAMYAAPNIRDNLLQEAVEFHGGEQLRTALAEMAKASGRTVEDVVHYAGYWATARYAKVKNARMLQVAQDNLAQAQAALGAAQLAVPVDPNAVAGAQLAVDSAQEEVDDRIAALNAPESATTHKVGLAGGFNNAQADAMMRVAERMFGAGKLQQMSQHLYRLNAFRMAMDIESGRTAPHLAAQFSPEMANALPEMLALRAAINGTQQQRERARKALIDKLAATSQYVPTTGDPAAGLDGDVLGTGFKTPNVAKDRRLTGRTETPADNGITASLAGLQRSASAAGWSRFTKGVADLYWSLTDAQREAAGMKATPLTALQRLGDNIVIHGDLGYSIGGADVMGALRKENVDDKSRFLEIMSLPTRVFAYAATQLNPTFSVVNLVRDVWERSEFLRTRDLRLGNGRKVDSTRAARRMITLARDPQMLKDMLANQWTANKGGKYSTLLREFQEYGGGGSRYSEQFSPDRANLVSQIESAGSNLAGAKRAIGRVVHKWNAAFDSVSSLAAYIALREQGMSREDAAAASLDLMNFRKAGAAMPVVRAVYAFAQPAVTGGANLIRGLKTKEGQTRMMGYMVAFAFLHTLMASLSGDDEELGKNKIDLLDEYTRDKTLPIPLGDGTVVKMPLGFGLPVFANTLMRIARDATAGDLTLDKVPGELVSRALTPQFSPIEDSKIEGDDKFLQRFYNTFAPTILKPSANVAMNTTGFGGEIVKKQYQDPTKFQSEQGSPMTPETYGDIAVFVRKNFGLDFAPEQVRELMKGYSLGGMRHLLNYSIENPHREAMGMETNMPVVSGIVSGYNANALLGEFNRFEQQASKLLKRKSAEEELDPQEEQVLDLYTTWLETDKELRKEQSALTRAGVPKGLDPARSAIRERRNLYQAALVRQFNLLQEQ